VKTIFDARQLGSAARAALTGAVLLNIGCGGAAPPSGPIRLLRALGTPTVVRFADETRPSVLLRPGEPRSCAVEARPGSRLSFAWAVSPKSPDRGFVELRVSAGGDVVYRKTVSTGRRRRWWPVSIPLARGGPLELTFRGDHVRAAGQPMEPGAESSEPWIVVASPRLDGPRTGPGRVLVWVSQDTVRADHLGSYGYHRPTSPHFDRLSRDWVVFEDAVATSSWTLPSLGSQFTSRYPLFHGASRENTPRDPRHPTVFDVLAGAGFTVLGVTANDFVSSYFRMADGFDDLRFTGGTDGPEGSQRAADVNRLALDALRGWRGGDLALFVHYMDPHYSYDPPPPYDRMFTPDRAGSGDAGPRRADVAKAEAAYDGEIAYTDSQVDLLLKELSARGLLRDAVIVYSADHGEEFLDRGGWKHSRTLYEEVVRVPLAIRVPGTAPGRVVQPVSLVDLAPTILDALGVKAPESFQGRSLLPLMRGRRLPEREIFAETERNPDGFHRLSVRHGRVKYIRRSPREGTLDPPDEELYDLGLDPLERRSDLGHPDADRLRRYAGAYLQQGHADARTRETVDLPPGLRARLRALGYLE
jgi:arylsulfatase A-like enzyme